MTTKADPVEGGRQSYVGLRCSGAFHAWVARLAAAAGMTVSDLIEDAVVGAAHRHGFDPPAPPR